MNQPDLFSAPPVASLQNLADSQPGCAVHPCQVCGKPARIKYCSRDCKIIAYNRKVTRREREQTERNQVFFAADPLPQEGWKKEAVELHAKGLGFKSIACLLSKAQQTVRRCLIAAGVYAPIEKHQGVKRKGIGPHSRIVKQKRLAMDQSAMLVLDRFKGGESIQTVCREIGLPSSSIFARLLRNSEYREISKQRRHGLYSGVYRHRKLRSKLFATEKAFQDELCLRLSNAGINYHREVRCGNGRIDLVTCGRSLEVKIQSNLKAIYVAIGQWTTYARLAPHLRPLLVFPSDVLVEGLDGYEWATEQTLIALLSPIGDTNSPNRAC